MRGHFRYLRFKTFPMTPRTTQCEVFFPLLSSSEHSGVPKDSQPPTFPSVGLHPHTWPKWGCDSVLVFYFGILCLDLKLGMFCYGQFVSFGIPFVFVVFMLVTQIVVVFFLIWSHNHMINVALFFKNKT